MYVFAEKMIERVGIVSYEAWFQRKPAKIHSPLYGTFIVEAPSRFFRDEIIKRFGNIIHDVAKELGYSKIHIILSGESIPQADPPLTPEQWSEIKAILSKIGKFSHSKGTGKAPKELFSHGFMEDETEEMKEKLKPSHVYKNMDGLDQLFILKQHEGKK